MLSCDVMWYILNIVFVPFLSYARHWPQLMPHERPHENYKNLGPP